MAGDCSHGASGPLFRDYRQSHWCGGMISPGGRLFVYESSPIHAAATTGKVREIRWREIASTREPGDLPTVGHVPASTRDRKVPVASTEVVVATDHIGGASCPRDFAHGCFMPAVSLLKAGC